MLLNIELKNFSSFRDTTDFSMVAEPSSYNNQNIAHLNIGNNDNIRLLKTAAIYGPNASGKSSLFRAVFEFLKLLRNKDVRAGENISAYDPFFFDESTRNSPIEFVLEFIVNNIKYRYEIEFTRRNIISEKLLSYEYNRPKTVLTRTIPTDTSKFIHIGYIGSESRNKKYELFHNQLFLSKFGKDIPNEELSNIYVYLLNNIEVLNASDTNTISKYNKYIKELAKSNQFFLNQLNGLIKLSDTGINEIAINEQSKENINFPDSFPERLRNQILNEFKYNLSSLHNFYDKEKLIRTNEPFPFEKESTGTQALFTLGGLINNTINEGKILFVDEIDTSLHTYLVNSLVALFNNEIINKKNAQLIFTSHDTNLLDRRLFRKDQIWFTEKNEQGISELFSLQDFSDVRENTPYEKWYLAGKFGALPNIKSLEKLYQ